MTRLVCAFFVLATLFGAAASAHAQPRSQVRIERPPAGSGRRGALPVPRWVPVAVGGATALGAMVVLVVRAKKRRAR